MKQKNNPASKEAHPRECQCEVCQPPKSTPVDPKNIKILTEEVIQLISKNPEKAAAILSEWLKK